MAVAAGALVRVVVFIMPEVAVKVALVTAVRKWLWWWHE